MRDLLERIYEEHSQALFAFLLNLTRDEQVTRDLLQEVFVRLAGPRSQSRPLTTRV